MIVDKKKWCPNCKKDVNVDEFGTCRRNKDGLQSYCKKCRSLRASKNKQKKQEYDKLYYETHREKKSSQAVEYYIDNKEYISIRSKKYNKDNKDKISETKKKYYIDNKEYIIKRSSEYYIDNKEYIIKRSSEYYIDNKSVKQRRSKEIYKSFCKLDSLLKRIPITDKPEFDEEGYITVVCKNDGNRFRPITGAIRKRILCYEGKSKGESNFYCSDKCAQECILYYFNPNQIDPRSKLYIPKSEQEEARRCQTEHLKILQIDEFGYNFCEKCGEKVDTVELHHTLPVAQFGLESINSAGHLLVCNECHKEFTKECKTK